MIIVVLFILLVIIGKAWRYFLEASDDLRLIRLLEPWFWFAFLNLVLSLVTANYDADFQSTGLLIQLSLSVWFAISISWIIQTCHHKTGIFHQSSFTRGRTIKFCHRCGTRLSKDFHTELVDEKSVPYFLFQMPEHLFKYVVFWVAQSLLVLISLFLVLRVLKDPAHQHQVVLAAVILVLFVPPVIYFFGRFRRYLDENKGMIWWDDIKGSVATWALVGLFLWALIHYLTP